MSERIFELWIAVGEKGLTQDMSKEVIRVEWASMITEGPCRAGSKSLGSISVLS